MRRRVRRGMLSVMTRGAMQIALMALAACTAQPGPSHPTGAPQAASAPQHEAARTPSAEPPTAVFGTPAVMGDAAMAKRLPLVQVQRPELPATCDGEQRLFFARGNQTILPQRLPRMPERRDALREGAPRELIEAMGERRVVDMPGGALVALDAGEFGAGLYWLADTAKQAVPLDAHLLHRIRWIEQTQRTVLAVSGLCHGEACHERSRSIVYEVSRADYAETVGGAQAWRIEPLHILRGCPEVITLDQGNDALLVATCHGLHRINELASTRVASWPSFLAAIDASDVSGPEHNTYYVSFGQLIASFAPGREAWFTTPQCVRR